MRRCAVRERTEEESTPTASTLQYKVSAASRKAGGVPLLAVQHTDHALGVPLGIATHVAEDRAEIGGQLEQLIVQRLIGQQAAREPLRAGEPSHQGIGALR